MSTIKVEKIQHPNSASVALTLDTSGYLALQAGSASTPAIQGPSDPNTGIFFPAADTIAFAEGGTEVLRIDSSGRVGIGTSSPGRELHISKSGGSVFRAQDSSGTNQYIEIYNSGGNTYYDSNNNGNGTHLFRGSGGTEYARFDSSGRLGIGTTSPSELLTIAPSSGSAGALLSGPASNAGFIEAAGGASTVRSRLQSSTTDAWVGTITNHPLWFSTNNTERARIDTSGRLLVGTSTARGDNRLQVEGNADGAGIFLRRDVSAGALTTPGTYLGTINFGNTEGGIGAFIRGEADAAWSGSGSTDNPGRLVFSTTADGASSPTERMRITNAGNVLVGCTVLPSNTVAGLQLSPDINNVDPHRSSCGTTTTSRTHIEFRNGNGVAGGISTSGSATAYNTSSDYRLKENITAVTDGITRLQQLKPSRFNFISDPSTVVDGFIAHEVQTVVPEAITGVKDAVDDDGNPIYQGIDQSKLVPLLTAALQEAVAKIESLEARLTAAGI